MSQQCTCYAKVSENDPRHSIWTMVNPKGELPLKHPLPVYNANFPDKMFYVGDATKLTDAQKEMMIREMHRKFGVPEEEIRSNLETGEFHILAEHVIVGICALHFRCML